MDPQHFDDLSRSLAAPGSRRTLARGAAGAAVVSLGLVGRRASEAKRRHAGEATAPAKKNKKKKCKPPCAACTTCKKGACAPQADGTSCAGGTCQGGACSAGSCTPACVGGQTCQPNGQCACPPDRPHFGGACGQTCSRCCTDGDCPDRFFMICDHSVEGGVCRCTGNTVLCNGICETCCADDDCIAYLRSPGDGFICNRNHGCACQEGLSECWTGEKYVCVDLTSSAQNCRFCGFTCGGEDPVCVNGFCSPG